MRVGWSLVCAGVWNARRTDLSVRRSLERVWAGLECAQKSEFIGENGLLRTPNWRVGVHLRQGGLSRVDCGRVS